MNVGSKIYELRTAKNLSQGDLADMLDVSRQSVSKWETDTAVPDLDKLMKLCDVFGISLDELVGRENTKVQSTATNKNNKPQSITQRIIGYILFTMSLVFGLVLMLFGSNDGDFIIGLPIALSMLICGLLCLFAGPKAFYWCIWAALAPISVLTPHIIALSALSTLAIIMMIVMIIMYFVGNSVFKDTVIKINRKKSILLILAWILPLFLYTLHYCLTIISVPFASYSILSSIVLNFVNYIVIAFLETYTVCYIKSKKKKQIKKGITR